MLYIVAIKQRAYPGARWQVLPPASPAPPFSGRPQRKAYSPAPRVFLCAENAGRPLS